MFAQTLPYCPQCIELWRRSCRHVDANVSSDAASLPPLSLHPFLHSFVDHYAVEMLLYETVTFRNVESDLWDNLSVCVCVYVRQEDVGEAHWPASQHRVALEIAEYEWTTFWGELFFSLLLEPLFSFLCHLTPPMYNLWRNLIKESREKADCPVSHPHSNNDTGTKEGN